MSRRSLFQPPESQDFLVLGDFEPPLGVRLEQMPQPALLGPELDEAEDADEAAWDSFAGERSEALDEAAPPAAARAQHPAASLPPSGLPSLQRITHEPDPEPGQVPEQASEPSIEAVRRSLMARGMEAVKASTRRLYAEGLPVVFGPAPADAVL